MFDTIMADDRTNKAMVKAMDELSRRLHLVDERRKLFVASKYDHVALAERYFHLVNLKTQ